SLGATLSAKVARRLREDARVDLSHVTFVLWDLPNGSEDYVPMPNGLGWIFAYQPGPLVSMTIGKLALRAVRGKPRDENIGYPSDPAVVKRLTGTIMNCGQYAERIKNLADRFRAGHSPRV